MSARSLPSAVVLASAMLLLLVSAILFSLIFKALASPAGYGGRLRTLEASAAQLRQSAALRANGPYGAGAVCAGPAVKAAPALRQALSDQAAAAGAVVKTLDVTPDTGASRGLAPIAVSLTVEGPYAAVVQTVSLLQSAQPEVFIDSLDLRPTVAGAAMHMTGRAFCQSSARP